MSAQEYKPNSSQNTSQPGCGELTLSQAQFWELSKIFRRSLRSWRFKPIEIRLLLMLCEETFDSERLVGRAELTRWSLELNLREDKLRKGPWREVCILSVVDFNAGQGTYELRPDMARWSFRGLRASNDLRAGQELPLVAERPVSGAYTEICRETVLTEAGKGVQPCPPAPAGSQSSKDWGPEFKRLSAAIASGTVEQEFGPQAPDNFSVTPLTENSSVPGGLIRRGPAEKSAGVDPPGNARVAQAAEKSAVPIAKLSLDLKAKLAIGSAEKSAAAFRWLESIDKNRALSSVKRCREQWLCLCRRDPDYVLVKLAGALEANGRVDSDGKPIENPLGYVAFKARADRKLGK